MLERKQYETTILIFAIRDNENGTRNIDSIWDKCLWNKTDFTNENNCNKFINFLIDKTKNNNYFDILNKNVYEYDYFYMTIRQDHENKKYTIFQSIKEPDNTFNIILKEKVKNNEEMFKCKTKAELNDKKYLYDFRRNVSEYNANEIIVNLKTMKGMI